MGSLTTSVLALLFVRKNFAQIGK